MDMVGKEKRGTERQTQTMTDHVDVDVIHGPFVLHDPASGSSDGGPDQLKLPRAKLPLWNKESRLRGSKLKKQLQQTHHSP